MNDVQGWLLLCEIVGGGGLILLASAGLVQWVQRLQRRHKHEARELRRKWAAKKRADIINSRRAMAAVYEPGRTSTLDEAFLRKRQKYQAIHEPAQKVTT